MKKHVLLISMIAALTLTGCGKSSNEPAKESDNKPEQSSIIEQISDSEEQSTPKDSSISPSSKESSSWEDSYVPPEEQVVTGDNFTINIPADLSSMTANCKKYIDDMRAQQRRLIAERGADADYYFNDLYGLDGVDLTRGVTASTNNYQDNTGGYRNAATDNNEYLDPIGATIDTHSDVNKGINITFTPSDALKNKEYTLTYGLKADLSDGKTIVTNETTVNIKNLFVNQKYYVKVAADGQESDIINFVTGDYPRWIDARPMFNVRDAGGYMTSSGKRIKQGLVYRGGEIAANTSGWYGSQRYTDDLGNTSARDSHIETQTAASKEAFRNVMGMVGGVEIDLRAQGECGKDGKYNACGFAENGDIAYSRQSLSSYKRGMDSGKTYVKAIFEAFAQADTKPVYYHCYGGADRTGTVGFLLGAMLGMSYTDLVIDFELTSYSSNPSRNYRSHLRNGPWNEWPGMINDLGWTKANNKTMKQGAEEYLKSCNISQATINKIREIMLED